MIEDSESIILNPKRWGGNEVGRESLDENEWCVAVEERRHPPENDEHTYTWMNTGISRDEANHDLQTHFGVI